MSKLLFTAVLFLTVSFAHGLGPAWYTCDPALCQGANGCVCPSWTNPGNYQPVDTPQFVLITHDDAVTPLSNSVVRQVTDGFKNANGCNVPATWFTIEFGTDCKLVKKLWDDNHEIAVHTVNHTALVKTLGEQEIEDQISGAKAFLASCGVPEADLKGFRSPYLIHNPLVRQILAKNGYLYDSSITEYMGDAEYTFTDTTVDFGSKRLWPYTMDRGIIQNCEWTAPDGECTPEERYPRMFELPLWDLPADNSGNTTYTMDPDGGFGGDLFTLLKTNFDKAYNGSRAPFPLFVHAPWFTPARIEATKKFIEYALTNPNTWFVTVDQMLQWMKNPVPANEYGATLKCKPVNLEALQPRPCLLYTVQNGDFLSNIAGKFGLVNTTELVKLNPSLSGANPILQPGQTLKIPPFNESCGAGIPSNGLGAAPAPAAAAQPTCRTWTVKTGDYLYLISEKTVTSVNDLVTLNNLGNANAGLSIGQTLKLPPYPDCCADSSCPPPEAASAPAPAGIPGIPIPPSDDKNRVEIMFDLGGASPTAFGAEYVSGFSTALAQLLGVSPDSVKLAVSSAGRRRRLMAAATTTAAAPAPAGRTKGNNDLMVQAVIVSADPLAVYNQTQKIIENGQLAATLASQGLSMPVSPVVTVYQAGKKVDVPSTFATGTPRPAPGKTTPPAKTNTTAPAAAPTSSSSDDMSTGVVIGIAIGSVVAGIAAIALAWFCLKDCRGKKGDRDDETPRAAAPSATFSLKQQQSQRDSEAAFMVKP